jgi:hypothetical protein
MAQIGAPVASRVETAGLSFVEWGAVFAGAVLAAALSFVLLTFGAAIGLSAVSPWPNSGLSAKVIASIAVFWAMAQQIGSIMVGGYVAGRMRSRWHEPGHEAEFRDGLHGALVWAVGVLISSLLVFATAGAAANTGANLIGKATGSVANSSGAMDGVIDTLLRSTTVAEAPPVASPPAAGQATTPARPMRLRAMRPAPRFPASLRAPLPAALSLATTATNSSNWWRSAPAFPRRKRSGAWTRRSTTHERPPIKPDVLQS